MSKGIVQGKKRNALEPEALAVGQIFIDKEGQFFRIDEISEKGKIHFQHRYNDDWSSYGEIEPGEFKHRYIRVGDWEAEYQKALAYAAARGWENEEEEIEANENENALALNTDKQMLESMIVLAEQKALEIEKMRRYMEIARNQMEHSIRLLNEKITKMQKVIMMIELYLGVNSEVVQFAMGAKVDVKEPICVRQLILYMDEEIGDPRPNPTTGVFGMDFQTPEDFDAWLVKDNHLDRVLPEKRGIVAVKPSRQQRRYSDNPMQQAFLENKNKMTYLLIRNGENLWRIWTDIVMGEYLFPVKKDRDIMTGDSNKSYYTSRDSERVTDDYRKNALILQGLIDRTDFLQPLPHPVNVFKPETYGKVFRMIRDAEMLLPDGRLRFKEWKDAINEKIGEGSRILITNTWGFGDNYRSPKDFSDRYLRYSSHDNYPPLPKDGVYQVESAGLMKLHYWDEKAIEHLKILYNPHDEVWMSSGWTYDPHPRKNRVGFVIRAKDDFVFNYDQIDLEDIDFYLNCRADRGNYVSMIPVLWQLRDALIAEREKEKDFVNLIVNRMGVKEDTVWAAVNWWKFKNKWKRRIDSDDAKALRMIEKVIRTLTNEK